MSPRSGQPQRASVEVTRAWDPSTAWLAMVLLASALFAYLPALNGTLLWDDNGHVTRPDLRSLAGLGRIWFEIGATQQYYPLLHSAFWLEHRLWGDATLGYHLANVVQHAFAACLFAILLRRLAVPGATLAALLFALHPVCVESVAWISEQKNTLSTLLYLGAALVFLRWHSAGTEEASSSDPRARAGSPAGPAAAESTQSRRLGGYVCATMLFVAALLTKTVTATLPAALLVVTWWKQGRLGWRRDILPLLPWLALGVIGGLFTARFERELIGAEGDDFTFDLLQRCLLAGRIFWFYLGKLVWPADLMFIYPRWTIDTANIDHWLGLAAALALLGGLVWLARGRATLAQEEGAGAGDPATSRAKAHLPPPLSARARRSPLAAVLLFGGALFPALGFFNVYPFRHSFVADHFQYLASLPIFALAAAACTAAAARSAALRRFRLPLLAALLLTLGSLTFAQSRIYRDVFRLYEHTLARNPESWLAHNNLAIALAETGRVAEAIPHLEAALRLKPGFPQAENNLGDDLVRLGRVAEAIPHFERAVQLEPRYAVAHCNLGMALAMSGRTEEAVPHFAKAVQIQPGFAEAELYWAVALAQTGRPTEAIPHFEQVLERDPSSVDAHLGLAEALRQLGRAGEAQEHVQAAQRLGAP